MLSFYMEEFTKKDDEVKNCPPYDNDFQLLDADPEIAFVQERDFTSGTKNYSARTEPSIRTKQLSTSEVDDESHFPTSPECSNKFNGKYNCSEPCLAIDAIVSSYLDPTLAKDVTPTDISSASTSRPSKAILSMEATRRNKNGKVDLYHRNWGGKVSSTRNGASKMEKGKEPIIYEADDSRSSSNRREDGRENFECISSRGVVSTVKRARINDSESESLVGAKVFKRSNNGNFSFMNWVTSMTKGLTRCQDGAMEASQHPFQHMKGVISPSISNVEREYIGISHGTTGFRSIFQGAYHHGNNVSSNKIKYIDDRKVIDALKGTVGEKASNVVSCVPHEKLNFDQRSSFLYSSFCFGDVEKENASTGPINFGVYGVAAQTNDIELRDKVLASSKRLNKNVCQVKNSLLAAMDSCGDSSDSCGELMTESRNDFQNSLWVTRLSHGVSSSHLKSTECSNCLHLSSHHKLPYMEAEKNNPQHNSVSHTGSVGSLRIVAENYESKLQLIISSEYCRKSKSMSSSFAQRLDALKHTKSSNKTCLFCGMSDHSIWECSEVVESKLEQYLKSISLYDSMKKAPCFCILCFKLDHWAATCTNSSSKGNQISFKSTAKIKHENQSFINYDEAIKFQYEGKKEIQQLHGNPVSQKENKTIETDIVVREEVRSEKNESAERGKIDLLIDPLADTVNEDKMKMTSSCSSENELQKSVFKSFCSRLPTSRMDEPKEIFVAVRKLRLSRIDILRWMKSRAPHYNLGGFFLRLRIGKLEKGLGATGYHVGCINGTSGQSSFCVCVGSSTHWITSPFISNQDFEEDELTAWWFQNLKDGTKIPSIEELNEKFQMRLKFGL